MCYNVNDICMYCNSHSIEHIYFKYHIYCIRVYIYIALLSIKTLLADGGISQFAFCVCYERISFTRIRVLDIDQIITYKMIKFYSSSEVTYEYVCTSMYCTSIFYNMYFEHRSDEIHSLTH